jgi:hypothetical protein
VNLPLPPKKDIDGVIQAVQESFNLLLDRTDVPAEIEADIRHPPVVLPRPEIQSRE